MTMKTLRVIAVALALLLAACAPLAEPEHEADPTTMEVTTEPVELGTGQEIALSETITVFEVLCDWGLPHEIWMRNEETGEEAFLIGARAYLPPTLGDQINGRYFWYFHVQPETCGRTGVYFYDVEQRRSIELLPPEEYFAMTFVRVEQGRVYVTALQGIGYEDEEMPVYYFEISALESGEAIVPQPAGMTVGALREVEEPQ